MTSHVNTCWQNDKEAYEDESLKTLLYIQSRIVTWPKLQIEKTCKLLSIQSLSLYSFNSVESPQIAILIWAKIEGSPTEHHAELFVLVPLQEMLPQILFLAHWFKGQTIVLYNMRCFYKNSLKIIYINSVTILDSLGFSWGNYLYFPKCRSRLESKLYHLYYPCVMSAFDVSKIRAKITCYYKGFILHIQCRSTCTCFSHQWNLFMRTKPCSHFDIDVC